MRWLIVEDALRDRKGHWFEYLGTFSRELRKLGDEVTILAEHSAEPFLIDQLDVKPILPASIWHCMSDGASFVRRYLRVPVHAWKTNRALKKYLLGTTHFDIIFVPTVLVHHLLGWTWLIKHALKRKSSRVVLFFPNTPIQLDLKTNESHWQAAPTAKLFARLIRSLKNEVRQNQVVLGAETHSMCEALTKLTGVPFAYLPHPVSPLPNASSSPRTPRSSTTVSMASYGSARHEKGCDVLVAAVEEYCRRYPDSRARFVLQSVEGEGRLWARLEQNSKVQLIQRYFANGEYARQLLDTDVLLLPYRRSSYGLRVSRVVIEAMVHGIPVVTTRGTTLSDQAREFGAATFCDDDNVDSLVQAIYEMEQNFPKLQQEAQSRIDTVQRHFSIRNFRELLLNQFKKPDMCPA